jgi:N-hydroxyarylamine O-acetyltransferase
VYDVATLHALLSHIGIREQPDADAAGLRVIHRAFLTHIAYDGITAQLGEHAPMDPDALIERTLRTGRGGYCFEINTILLTLLEALGFRMERRQGIVGPRDAFAQGLPTNHLALVATVRTGEAYICDAGWGEGPLDPIPLTAGTVGAGPLTWMVAPEDGGAWWVGQHAWGSTPGFRFGATPEPLDAFAPHHERLASSPASSFAATLVVQQPADDHIVTLRARTLSRKGPGRDERTILPDEQALATTLREAFSIDPDALGPGRVARLWRQACAQHEAFVSSPAPAAAPPRSAST